MKEAQSLAEEGNHPASRHNPTVELSAKQCGTIEKEKCPSSDNGGRCLAIVSTLMAVDLIVLLWGSVILDGCPGAAGHAQGAESNAHIAKLAPELTPAVAHDPIVA